MCPHRRSSSIGPPQRTSVRLPRITLSSRWLWLSRIPVSDGAAVAVKYGEVNENSKINIVDAQIALDVGKGIYKGSDKLFVAGLLAADVNHDNVVDAKDAYSIQIYVHYNAFTVPAGN